MVMLCIVCGWHAIIAMCPVDVAPRWDNIAFASLAIIYGLFHVVFFFWMYFVVSFKEESCFFFSLINFFVDLSTTTCNETKR